MLQELQNSAHGCRLSHHWYGGLALADDVLLLSTSLESLQSMITICENFANENDLIFSTDPDKEKSKTVCMAFNYKAWRNLKELKLNGDNVPWVEKKKYLGTKLHCDGTTYQDTKEKRGIFISECMNINQQYHFASPEVKLKLFLLHNTHFSGSNIWDFSSNIFQQLCNSFNTNASIMFDLHQATSCLLIERFTNGKHAKKMIFTRFLKFINGLLTNRRQMVRSLGKLVCNDIRSLTGRNLFTIKEESKVNVRAGLTQHTELNNWQVYDPKEGQEWKLPLLVSLLAIRDSCWEISFDDESESLQRNVIQVFLDSICTS